MEITEINTIIATLATTGAGLGWLFQWRSNKRIKNAEADTAEAQAQSAKHETQLKRIEGNYQSQIEALQANNEGLIKRLAEAHEMQENVIQSRQESERKQWQLERTIDKLNDRILTQAERIMELSLKCDHYKNNLCTKNDCKTRKPANPALIGTTYEPFVMPDIPGLKIGLEETTTKTT